MNNTLRSCRYPSKAPAILPAAIMLATSLWLAPASARCEQAAMVPMLSLQGFTGLFNTPSAHTQAEGSLQALYSNQVDQRWRDTTPWQDNYLFSVGLFNFVEVGGRLTNTPLRTGVRDLSANFKLSSAALTRDKPLFPVAAAGIQDVGGGLQRLRTSYLALSEDLWRFRFSTGYGFGPSRMRGVFGGAEFKVHEWIYLVGEHDTRDTNIGLRLIAPQLPIIPVSFTFTAKSALSHQPGNIDIAAGFSIPLDFRGHKAAPGPVQQQQEPVKELLPALAVSSVPEPRTTKPEPRTAGPALPADRRGQLSSLRDRLVKAGFVNVRVGEMEGAVLVVEYENVRYNHNELDALGVVAGMAAEASPEGLDNVQLVVKRKGIRMMRVSAPLAGLRSWLVTGIAAAPPALAVDKDPGSSEGISFVAGDGNSGWLWPSLMLYPGLTTFVGTEAGAFDYLLAVKPDLGITVWKGGVLNARWDIPVAWSDNFDDGKSFAYARNKAVMERLMLFQGVSLAPGLMANVGAGMILHNTYGTLNELVWSPGSGTHRFRVSQAWATNDATHENQDVWLGSYHLYLGSLDLFLEGTAGKFWGQDKGGLVELKRFFGDTALSLYYKDTVTAGDHKRWQAAGIQFSFPLTPRRDMKLAPVQIRGNEEWSYAQETVLAVEGQYNNPISTVLGVNPMPAADLYRSYLNRDRLNEEYVRHHIDRLRDAWSKYRDRL